MFNELAKTLTIPSEEESLPGRSKSLEIASTHFVLGTPTQEPFGKGISMAIFGAGCFWGIEKGFWQLSDVFSTNVGYAGGYTPNPTYEEVCSGATGHNEVVRVLFSGGLENYWKLLKVFWEIHDPTQGMRQGNDVGTQYRSGIYYVNDQQKVAAERSREIYNNALVNAGFGMVTTEILPLRHFYFAEDYHQQYLAKNPAGYCGIGGTGIDFLSTEEPI